MDAEIPHYESLFKMSENSFRFPLYHTLFFIQRGGGTYWIYLGGKKLIGDSRDKKVKSQETCSSIYFIYINRDKFRK